MDKDHIRGLFPVTRNVVYFNHAAVGPLSTRACDAMTRHAHDQRDFGALHWRAWYAEYDKLRQLAANLIGATPAEIAILKNTSEGMSFVAEGFRWQAGDNVITTDLEFPSNYTPWKRQERRGVECRVVGSRDGAYTADDVERLIDARTRIVSVSSVAFHNGFAPDLDAIGALCAARGVLFCVDAIQSVGALPIDVRRSNITFLAADGHKWMCGPEGAALFYVAAEQLEQLEVLESGWTNFERMGKFIDCPLDFHPNSRRFEAGSLNTNGVYGLRAALELLDEQGIATVSAEVVRLATRLADALEAIGWTVASPRPIRSGIIGVKPPAVDTARIGATSSHPMAILSAIHGYLEKERIVTAPREGLLRLSPHFYNDDAEIDTVVQALAAITM
jgi:cysteine desulfurase / selenocysteine lyase